MSDSRRPYWPALDGLRAVAVVLVVGYHASGALGNGFVGVDVFFVLSGFLITSLLLGEQRATGRIGLAAFYLRRVRRLYPALLTVCVAVTAAAAAVGEHVREVVLGALASLGYVANVWEYSGHETYLLQHTWTLALEEQFYLLWPVLLVFVLRSRSAAWLVGGAWLAVELADRLVGEPPVLHTYVRAAGLPLGCVLAFALRDERVGRRLAPLAAPCLLAIVVLGCAHTGALPDWPVGPAAVLTVPVLAALVAAGPAPTAAFPALLACGPARWLGRRSYGLYLWHFPVLSLAINQAPSQIPLLARNLAGIALSLVAAALSYRLVEGPFLRRVGDRLARTALPVRP